MRKEYGGLGFQHLYDFNLAMLAGEERLEICFRPRCYSYLCFSKSNTFLKEDFWKLNWVITLALFGIASMLHK